MEGRREATGDPMDPTEKTTLEHGPRGDEQNRCGRRGNGWMRGSNTASEAGAGAETGRARVWATGEGQTVHTLDVSVRTLAPREKDR